MKLILYGILAVLVAGCTNYGSHRTYQKGRLPGPSVVEEASLAETLVEMEAFTEAPAAEVPAEIEAFVETPAEVEAFVETPAAETPAVMEADDSTKQATLDMALLPPNAKPGECYARVYVPPAYKTVTEQVVVQEASESVEIVPAEYEWFEEKVLVEPASERRETIPAQYEWVQEKVLVSPAQSVWKRGGGLLEDVDGATGEIMCLVEVPAEYKTVRKQVMTQAADVRSIVVPARYETVRKKRLVSPERRRTTPVAARYETVSKQVKVSEGHIEWRKVLCETNLSRDVVTRIQQALANAGYDPGPMDGIVGPMTRSAVKVYQQNNRLAIGGLTYETLNKLGVDVPR